MLGARGRRASPSFRSRKSAWPGRQWQNPATTAPTNRRRSKAPDGLFRECRPVLPEEVGAHDHQYDQDGHGQQGAERPPQPYPKRDRQKNRERIDFQLPPYNVRRNEISFEGRLSDEDRVREQRIAVRWKKHKPE